MNNIVAYEHNRQLFNYASDVAKEYGVFSKMVVKDNYSGKPDIYLVFGLDPIEENINPVEIINRNNRSTNLFYPENFAVNINDGNPLLIWESIVSYLSSVEFLYELYSEFRVPLPQKIRSDELAALISFYCGKNNPNYDSETRSNYAKGLKEFFKQEASRGKFLSEWQEFYRSDLFDKDKSFVGNFFIFLKRHEPETKLDVLLESNFELKKAYIPEHYYDEFRNTIKEKYPDVKYTVSDKKIVDKGMIVDPKTKLATTTQFGLTVTDKQYDKICERRFAEEGYKCLDGLNQSYFEGRDIFYKATDENIIASVFNNIRLRWAKCPSIESLREKGRIEKIEIPYSQMKNFYVSMQQYNVPFVIDNDVNNNPSLDVVHVLYNAADGETVGKLVAGLTWANISLSHVKAEDIPFCIDVDRVDKLIQGAKSIAQEQKATAFLNDKEDVQHDLS